MKTRRLLRIYILGIFITLCGGGILWRLFTIQILNSAEFQQTALSQYKKEAPLEPRRGCIYDRHLTKLAIDLEYVSYGIFPKQVEDPRSMASLFAKYCENNYKYYYQKIEEKKPFIWLERKVHIEVAEQLEQQNLKGISTERHFRRCYPYNSSSSQIIGFTDIDNKGVMGLELQYDAELRGKTGKALMKRDAIGRHIPDPNLSTLPPVDGSNIILTLDLIYQMIAEEELEKAVKQWKAKNGMLIMMNPKTGEILSMCCYPSYDPNNPSSFKPYLQKNRTITDVFEPGSTFKIVTASAALEEKVKKPSDIIFCENGQYKINRRIINDVSPHGKLMLREVIEKSSNIGTIKLAEKVGEKTLYKYARDFGFGNKTGVGLIGEVSGYLKHPRDWSRHSLASIAIGQEVAITALQLVNAYCAVANEGVLMKPYLVKAMMSPDGEIKNVRKPQKIRRVISKAIADTVMSFLRGVIERGTGKSARIKGIPLAGKTGTAEKAYPDGRGYIPGEYIGSFIGIYPADNPQIVCLIVIDTPRGAYYGSTVAAPVFRNIIRRIINLPYTIGEPPQFYRVPSPENKSKAFRIPGFRGLYYNEAKSLIKSFSAATKIIGSGQFIIAQDPLPGTTISPEDTVIFTLVENNPVEQKNYIVPSVEGLSLRDALNLITQANLKYRISGSGTVVKQSLRPGTKIVPGTVCYLKCQAAR